MTEFRWDEDGERELMWQLAKGFAEFGEEGASAIAAHAPSDDGTYKSTIHATTFLDNQIVSGPPVRGKNVRSTRKLWVAIWTSSPLGHLLELGTDPHRIRFHDEVLAGVPKGEGSIQHPGSRRYPHFWPGLASVAGQAGQIISRGGASVSARFGARINTRVL